jgi:thiol-disulfide isomerase/thioredoxin
MKINILILLSLLLALVSWTFYQNKSSPPITDRTVPDFSYETLTGATGNLYDHKGKPILLHFWATWCAPCLKELPTLFNLAENQKNLTILAIAVNDKTPRIQNFLKKMEIPLPENVLVIEDKDKTISKNLYKTYKLPESFLIHPDLSLVRKVVGAQENWNNVEWSNEINDLSPL